jgi:hypothetical protein
MPGVLFHHETKTKDWFYDLMEPWKHYIPVDENLTDLWDRYRWAEDNPEKAKKIAEEATKLSVYLLSSEYMDELYNELFVDYLGKVVEAYQPEEGKSWTDCLERYKKNTIETHLLSQCDELECNTQWDATRFLKFKHSYARA